MYKINEITFQRWVDAERERQSYMRRFGIDTPIYTDCPEHGFVQTYRGHCLDCMLEVYEEYLEEGS